MNHEKIKEDFEKVAKSHGYCLDKDGRNTDVYAD